MLKAERNNLSKNAYNFYPLNNLKNELKKINDSQIINLIKRHRLELFFYKNNLVNLLIPSLDTKLKKFALNETRKNLDLTFLTVEIAKLLDSKKIKYLILKGIPLSIKTLKNKSSRGSGDLDLFIEKSEIEKCINIFESKGFKLYKTSIPKFHKSKRTKYCLWANYETSLTRKSNNGFQFIDLHWELSYVQDNLPTFEECWANREEIKISNYLIKTLSIEHEFLLSCAHSAKDKWMLIRNLIDIDRLARINHLKKNKLGNINRQISMSSLITYDLSQGEYLIKYIQCGRFSRFYCRRISSYFLIINPKQLSKDGWSPLSRVLDIFHRLFLTNKPEDWLKIILVNIITPESIVNPKSRDLYPFYKIIYNRLFSLKEAFRIYFLKKLRKILKN